MQRDELAAIGELTGEALAGIAGQVHGFHDGIAGRVFSSVGPLGRPVRIAHDLVTETVYASLQRSVSTAVRTGTRALSVAVPPDSPSLESTGAGRVAIGLLNGAVGDTLERRQNALALRTSVRRGGENVEPTRSGMATAYPDATAKLAVFVHGLGETDDAWSRGSQRHVPYGQRLRSELGYTPLYVRYNTGRPAAESGGELAGLLGRVVAAWPVTVEEIVLIGHAMGGLVARCACEAAPEAPWRKQVTHLLTLGSLDRGAPLERVAGAFSSAMARIPETRTLAATLGRRSAGLRELRSGGRGVPFPAEVEHYFVDYRRFGPLRHLRLLNDPDVYEQLRARITGQAGLSLPRAALPGGAPQRP